MDFPIENGGSFYSYVTVYQRVIMESVPPSFIDSWPAMARWTLRRSGTMWWTTLPEWTLGEDRSGIVKMNPWRWDMIWIDMIYNFEGPWSMEKKHVDYVFFCDLGKFHHDLTVLPHNKIIVSKGNHPQMAELFRLVKYYILPRYYVYIQNTHIYIYTYNPLNIASFL